MNKFSKKFIHFFNIDFQKLEFNYLTDVAKLVNALDLGPSNLCFESSSLSIRTSFNLKLKFLLHFHSKVK